METWTNGEHGILCQKRDRPGTLFQPSIYVDVWSDSALIHCEPEVSLEDFYSKILSSIRTRLSPIPFYCVVCTDEEIAASTTAALGGIVSDEGTRPYWHQVAGSGPAWINLWTAIEKLNTIKGWHKKYSLYAVGKESVWTGHAREEDGILSCDGKSIVLSACDW